MTNRQTNFVYIIKTLINFNLYTGHILLCRSLLSVHKTVAYTHTHIYAKSSVVLV